MACPPLEVGLHHLAELWKSTRMAFGLVLDRRLIGYLNILKYESNFNNLRTFLSVYTCHR